MKKLFKVAMLALIGCWLAGPSLVAKVKEKKISYASCAYYYGPAEKKDPMGEGKLLINEGYKGAITITGTFNETTVSNAVVDFAFEQITFKGKVFYEKKLDMTALPVITTYITIYMSEGKLYHEGEYLGSIKDNPFVVKLECTSGFARIKNSSGKLFTIDQSRQNLLKIAVKFADCDTYQIENHDVVDIYFNNGLVLGSTSKAEAPLTLLFSNGAKTELTDYGNMTWTRTNGDYIKFNMWGYGGNYHISECSITLASGSYIGETLTHKFANGNIYVGRVKYLLPDITLNWLATVREVDWPWEKFCQYAVEGKLTYADGTVFSGSFSNYGQTNGDKLDNKSYYEGVMYDSTGTEIDDYQNGANRAQRALAEQARIAEEEARIAEEEAAAKAKALAEQKKKQELYNKYGKKYVDTIVNSGGKEILIGTPLSLLKAFEKERFLGVLLELTLEVNWGNEARYKWWTARPDNEYWGTTMGYIWIRNGKVASISYN